MQLCNGELPYKDEFEYSSELRSFFFFWKKTESE